MKKEIWKPIISTKGSYEVSNMGKIRCIATKQIANTIEIFNLGKKGTPGMAAVHRIVLEAFVGPRPKKMVCRHLDGNSLNNNLSNLKWGTPKENAQDMVKHGRSWKDKKLSKKHKRKISQGLKRRKQRNAEKN